MAGVDTAHFSQPAEILPLAFRLSQGSARPDLVAIGLAELMMNALEHGVLGLGYEGKRALMEQGRFQSEVEKRLAQPPWRDRSVAVTVEHLADLVRYRVDDGGPGFDWRPWLMTSDERVSAPNGRGIALARSLCFESLNFSENGSVVEAVALREVVG